LARIFTAYFCRCIFGKKSKNSKSGFLRNDYLKIKGKSNKYS
jgi:hypothetical protein